MLIKQYLTTLLALIFVCIAFTALASEQEVDCKNAMTTMDINHCAAEELAVAKKQMENYLQESLKHNASDPELVSAIEFAQQEWSKYSKAHCDSVYTQWRDGTIRGVISLSCRIKLT